MLEVNRSSLGLDKLATTLVLALGLLFCTAATWTLSRDFDQRAIVAIIAGLLIAIGLITPLTSIVITFVYLGLLGDIRRLFVYQSGVLIESDPLLLVGPLVAIGLILTPFAKGQVDFNKGLSRLVFCLALIMLLEVFNPYQGGLLVGLAGGMFYIIPLVWYYLGQTYGSEKTLHVILFRVILPVGVLGGLFALWQTFVSFPPYQQFWIDLIQQKFPLTVGDRVRPFSFFVSPAEFAHYMIILTVIAFAPLYCGRFRPIVLAGFLGIAGFVFQGGRGPVVTTAGALAVMFAALGRSGRAVVARLGIAGAMAVASIALGLMLVSGSTVNEKIAPLLQRQQQGLTNPLTQGDSTLIDHVQIGASGIIRGIYSPLGEGLGATTIAARLSSDDDASAGSTELDFSNMFASLGLAGGVLYLVITGNVFVMSYKLVQYKRSVLSLAILGILVGEVTQWLNGGHYATSSLIWFTIGSLAKQTDEMEQDLAPASL